MSTSFSVPCKHCGNPIIITVEEGHSGGVGAFCQRCAHQVSVAYSYCGGKLTIYNVF